MPGARRPLLLVALAALLAALVWLPRAAVADVPDDIMGQVAAIRGLEPLGPVLVTFQEPARLRAVVLEAFESEQAARELEISRRLIVLLGLFSPDADLQATFIDLYAGEIAGYYRADEKRMYVVSGLAEYGPNEKVTLAHEYTHALQDQHFDLTRLQQAVEHHGDRELALQALIEGDATISMVLWARRHLSDEEIMVLASGGDGGGKLSRAPLVIREETLFPYNDGALFVLQLLQRGGFEAVNAAFRDPPQSTEQVLHPEKYVAREQPTEVTLPDLAAALGPGWRLLRSDVLGELDYRILLEQFLDPVAAAKGSYGWAGDRFALLESRDGELALALLSEWDSQEDARELFSIYADAVYARYGRRATVLEQAAPGRRSWATPNGPLMLEQWGNRVAIVMAADERAAAVVMGELTGRPVQPAPGRTPLPAPVQLPR